MSRESKGKFNTLNQLETYKLLQWIDGQRERIGKEDKTVDEWASEASEILKFPITRQNMATAMHSLRIRHSRHRGERRDETTERLGQLTAAVETLNKEVAHYRNMVDALIAQFGTHVRDSEKQHIRNRADITILGTQVRGLAGALGYELKEQAGDTRKPM